MKTNEQYRQLQREVDELKADKNKLLTTLSCISDMCVGEVAMSIKLDAEYIGQMIYADTGLTHPELREIGESHYILTKAQEKDA